jgi:AcrR family transcriptional regulator
MFSFDNGEHCSLLLSPFTMNAIQTRERHREEMRRRILDAARASFIHEGYESFSLRKLAQQIEYSPAAIYKYFKNKNEIFECLAEESFAALVETSSRVKPAKAEDPVDTLKRGMRAYVDFGLKNPDHYRFAFLLQPVETTRPPKPRAAYEGLRDRVQKCIDAGRFRRGNVELMAQSLWAAAHGVTSLLVQRPSFPWAAHSKLISQVINSAVQGLLAPEN